MGAHAEFGPSAADRWMVCTASSDLIRRLRASGEIPPDESSRFAAEGTAAHEIRERCLLNGTDPQDYLGEVLHADGYEFTVDEDMADALVPGIDWLRERLDHIDVEVRVRLDPWLPGQFGTMDSGGVFGDTLLVCDFKYGAGVDVAAEGNRQMRFYALGYWHFLGRPAVKKVLMVIDQPRMGGLKFWEITLDELTAFGDEAAQVFLDIKAGRTEFHPSEKGCKWCPAKNTEGGCPAYNRWMLDLYANAFDDEDAFSRGAEPTFEHPDRITPERRWWIVRHAELARAWLAKLHEDSLRAALNGKPDPGSKAVVGRRGKRFLTDEKLAGDVLFDALGIDAYEPLELIGITEIEKRLKPGRRKPGYPEAWTKIQGIVDQAEGKPILVDASDERDAITPIVDQFDDLGDDDLDLLK